MRREIEAELKSCLNKIEELRTNLKVLEDDNPKDRYRIMITHDRLAYWEGKAEGLRFALNHVVED